MKKQIDPQLLAKLTNVPLTDTEVKKLNQQFSATLDTISTLTELNTDAIEATPQVTALKNVYRDDEIDLSRCFTLKQIEANALATHHGYIMVKAIFNET